MEGMQFGEGRVKGVPAAAVHTPGFPRLLSLPSLLTTGCLHAWKMQISGLLRAAD